ncbi:MAG TPA: membrane protein insertion efficiency factor YidD [Chitinophagaceae bacterium]|nr:membrane protein insertion efficiency factor YidD [Chitinophagaceae bacterium]
MRLLLLFLVRCYWLIPKSYRRKCIFKESCSHFVYNTIKEQGVRKGLLAFRQRTRQCRPGYVIYQIDKQEWVILNDRSVISRGATNL